jgi:hypothetical protein
MTDQLIQVFSKVKTHMVCTQNVFTVHSRAEISLMVSVGQKMCWQLYSSLNGQPDHMHDMLSVWPQSNKVRVISYPKDMMQNPWCGCAFVQLSHLISKLVRVTISITMYKFFYNNTTWYTNTNFLASQLIASRTNP